MSAFFRAAWWWTKCVLIVLLFLTFVSCSYYLEHLRFNV